MALPGMSTMSASASTPIWETGGGPHRRSNYDRNRSRRDSSLAAYAASSSFVQSFISIKEGDGTPGQSRASSAKSSFTDRLGSFIGEEAVNNAMEEGLGEFATAINLVKCCAGCGMFSLPFAFLQGGLWLSFACTLAIGALSAHTVCILAGAERLQVQKMQEAAEQEEAARTSSFTTDNSLKKKDLEDASAGLEEELIHQELPGSPCGASCAPSYLTYPELGALLFPEAEWKGINFVGGSLYVGICATSLGVSAAYFDFIAATMHTVVPDLSEDIWKLVVAGVIGPLSLLRSFKYLAWSSIVGNVGVASAIVVIIILGCKDYSDLPTKQAPLTLPAYDFLHFPQYFGAAAFLFAIHLVILPISQSMKEPQQFKKVCYWSYGLITILNCGFAMGCYMLFQTTTDSNVTSNLASGIVRDIVLVMLAVAMLFTIPMILSASREILEESVIGHLSRGTPTTTATGSTPDDDVPWKWTRNGVRLGLVALVVGLVFAVKDFNDMVSLVGGLANCFMGFVIPPLLHVRVQGDNIGSVERILHYCIVVFGVVACIGTTTITMKNIVG